MMCTDHFTIDKDFQQLLDENSVDEGFQYNDKGTGDPEKYISDIEDAGGLVEADDSEDEDSGLPPLQASSRREVDVLHTVVPSTDIRPRRAAHSPGHFRRLVNGELE